MPVLAVFSASISATAIYFAVSHHRFALFHHFLHLPHHIWVLLVLGLHHF